MGMDGIWHVQPPGHLLGTGITVLLVLMPLIYRLSRSIWIAMFTHKEA